MHAENGPVVAAPAFFKKKFMHTKGLNREFALPKTIPILVFFPCLESLDDNLRQ